MLKWREEFEEILIKTIKSKEWWRQNDYSNLLYAEHFEADMKKFSNDEIIKLNVVMNLMCRTVDITNEDIEYLNQNMIMLEQLKDIRIMI